MRILELTLVGGVLVSTLPVTNIEKRNFDSGEKHLKSSPPHLPSRAIRRIGYSTVTFTDVTDIAGVGFGGEGGGAVFGDYDLDCDLDLFVTNFVQGEPDRLYENNGDGTFTDVTMAAGVGDTRGGQGTAFADYDNDGDLDLYVASWNPLQTDILFQNNGDGTFTDVSASAGINNSNVGHGMAWGDYNNDGLLDIYVTNTGQPNVLYRNNGDGTFTDLAPSAGVDYPGSSDCATFGDFDVDGDLDLYVGNFFENNILYQNNGNGTFTDVTVAKGVGEPDGASGVSFGDYDNDGYLDLYVANRFGANVLYRNNGPSLIGPPFTFTDVTAIAGVGDPGGAGGCAFGDFDYDGYLDIYISNGVDIGFGANVLYRNNGNGTFTDVTASAGVGDPGAGHGNIWGDYDNDGDLDIYVVNAGGTCVLYKNNGTSNNWIIINTVGEVSNRDGIGARVTVSAGSLTMVQEVSGGDGHDTQNSLPLEFGVGSFISPITAVVDWPSGTRDICSFLSANRFYTVTEGEGCFETSAPGCPPLCVPIEPPAMRTQGYWRRQCKDNPHEDICEYVDHVHRLSDLFDTYDCSAICDLLEVEPPENDMCRKAERQFMALLLNIASEKVALCNCLTGGLTVEDVVTEIEALLSGPRGHATCERAKTLADELNNGENFVDCNSILLSGGATQEGPISLQAFPNPFTSETSIRLQLPYTKGMTLKIYDLTGRLVRTLVDSQMPITDYESPITVSWDGRDEAGERLSSGIYFYRLSSGKDIATRKMTLLR